jgi:hypothetical protein
MKEVVFWLLVLAEALQVFVDVVRDVLDRVLIAHRVLPEKIEVEGVLFREGNVSDLQ